MAARLNPRNSEAIMLKIKAAQLVEKLQNHALNNQEMGKSQVTAATWLLERILARAENPKEHHHTGDLNITVGTGVPGG
jgi:hypothetical protein